jgi:hypothetical protein
MVKNKRKNKRVRNDEPTSLFNSKETKKINKNIVMAITINSFSW